MKKLSIAAACAALLTTGAFAADLGVISQPTPVGFEPAYDWTGFYAGVFVGAARSDSLSGFTIPALPTYVVTGDSVIGVAGVQLGYDYQIDSFVLGAVADIALSSFETGLSDPLLSLDYSSKLEYLGTIRARAGFLPTDNLLIYAHGGLAYGRFSPVVSSGFLPPINLESTNRIGWTIGAGLEYGLTKNISVQTEYAYTDLGTATATGTGVPRATATESLKLQTVKAGLNFRF